MRKLSTLLVLTALFVAADVMQAQGAGTTSTNSADSSSVKRGSTEPSAQEALDNLQKAAADLSKAVEVAVTKVASSPELKTAALQIAAGAVNVAQQSLAEQLRMIEAALNAAARQIAAAQSANAQKSAPATQTPSK